MQKHMEIFSTTAKLFVWRLRLRVQKAQSPHYWNMGGENLKSVDQYKYLEAVLDTELPGDKDIQRQLRYQYCAANKLRASFSDVQTQLKMYFFVPFVRSCMHHSYGGISESHACKDCVWLVILDAGLYTTFLGERVLVVMTHQVQCNIPTFEALLWKNMYLFLERCRRSNNVWLPALTQSDCSYSSLFFEHYNRILLCDWVLGHCSVFSLKGVHATVHSCFTWPWPV